MPHKLELRGKTFGRLTVLHETNGRSNSGDVIWMCKCICGNYLSVGASNLKSGNTESCGCYFKECVKTRFLKHGESVLGSDEYLAWRNMKDRCLNPNSNIYKYYGAKGVKICERWLNSFENFLKDMGRRPSANHSLDRYPNKKGDYSPDNCRWATRREQDRNKTSNVWVCHGNEKMILSDFSEITNIPMWYLRYHISRKKSTEEIINLYKIKQFNADKC